MSWLEEEEEEEPFTTHQYPGRFLSIVGRDPSVFKSNRLHVDIIQFFFFMTLR